MAGRNQRRSPLALSTVLECGSELIPLERSHCQKPTNLMLTKFYKFIYLTICSLAIVEIY